jgi:hypothetical protein
VPLRTGISIMPSLSTFKASVARGGVGCTGPHGRTNWSHRAVLRVCRAWSLRPWARKLLRSALELLILLKAGTDMAADHSLMSDLLDGTELPVVR